jgi:hypothetical protein
MWVQSGHTHSARRGQAGQPAGGGVPVDPPVVAVEQQRPGDPDADGAVDRLG